MYSTIHYTPREFDVIKLLLLGNFRKKISSILKISSGAVDNLIKRLYIKLDCHSIEDLIIFLLTNGFSVNAERTKVTFLGKEI